MFHTWMRIEQREIKEVFANCFIVVYLIIYDYFYLCFVHLKFSCIFSFFN